jgi:NADPH:quinone reductase-like Zn-dependent oxidoreductase
VIEGGSLALRDRALPDPVGDEVLVEVAGAGLNRADLLQLRGGYPAPHGWPNDVPGLELSGRVHSVGERVANLAPGDRVMGIVGGGAQATHALTTESLCAPVPDGLDLVAAGGVPEAFVTAHDALARAKLRPGERVLVQGVGSGVGTAAIQVARAMGAVTVGTSRTAEKLERAKEIGMDEGVEAGAGMAAAIGEVDVVLELVGGSYLETDVEVCRPKGRIVVIGLIAGASAALDMGAVLRKRLIVMGTVLRSRPEHEKAAAMAAFAREIVPLLARGAVHPVMDHVVPLEEVTRGYELMESNANFGKIVLRAEA